MANVTNAETDHKTASPVFGPPVTTEMWQSRWPETFKSISGQHRAPYGLPTSVAEQIAHHTIMLQRCQALVPAIHLCEREARELRIHTLQLDELSSTPQSALIPQCVVVVHRMGVEECRQTWKELKNGKSQHGDVQWRWQDYPLQLRRGINDLLEAIRKEEDSGYWVIDERSRVINGLLMEARGQNMVGRNAFGELRGRVAELAEGQGT